MTKEQEIAQFWGIGTKYLQKPIFKEDSNSYRVMNPTFFDEPSAYQNAQSYYELQVKFAEFQRLARESYEGGKPEPGEVYWCVYILDPEYLDGPAELLVDYDLWPSDVSVFAKCYFKTKRAAIEAINSIGGPFVLYEIRQAGIA